MPGDLRGLNTDGNLQLLATYGMAAVEYRNGGELLQITSGKKALLSLPIPSSLLSIAPGHNSTFGTLMKTLAFGNKRAVLQKQVVFMRAM
ncbi:MAG: hypothetical protein IPQ06_12755 [Chitinophagaceae bacterium]|nr:hypothetical protein [Chitinophagaceae bacterium]